MSGRISIPKISINVIGNPPINESPLGVKWLVRFLQSVQILCNITNIQKVILVDTTKTGHGVYKEAPPDNPNKLRELKTVKILLFNWASASGIKKIEKDFISKNIHKNNMEIKTIYTKVILFTSISARAAYYNIIRKYPNTFNC